MLRNIIMAAIGLLLSLVAQAINIDKEFKNPSSKYRLVQFQMEYLMGLDMTDQQFEDYVSKLHRYGIGGVQVSVKWGTDYLQNKKDWERISTHITRLHGAGLRVWIHDENGYPSGAAGGLVVKNLPEHENKGWCKVKSNNKVEYPIAIIDEDTQAQSTISQFGQTGRFPSLLSKQVGKEFVKVTHQAYADHVPDLGNKIELIYTNEANLMTTFWDWREGKVAKHAYVPYHSSLPTEFQKMHGYAIEEHLEDLFSGNTSEAKLSRLHYYQTVSQMYANNYAGTITDWCHKNGTLASGHPLLEEYMAMHVANNGDMMLYQSKFDIPACDIPVPTLENFKWEFWMPKYLSSSALLNKQKMVIALIDPIIGGNGLSCIAPDTSRLYKTINMAFLCGINQFSTYIPYESYPDNVYNNFSTYQARLASILRNSYNAAQIAMFYPIETFQANFKPSPYFWSTLTAEYDYLQKTQDRIGEYILRNGIDFNYLNSKAILDAKIKNNKLVIGNNSYSVIVMPNVEVIPLSVLNKLKDCQKKGINVYWVDALPTMGINKEENNKIKQISKSLSIETQLEDKLQKMSVDGFDLQFNTQTKDLCIGRYILGEKKIYYLVNDSDKIVDIAIDNKDSEMKCRLFNPRSGDITTIHLPSNICLDRYSSVIIEN